MCQVRVTLADIVTILVAWKFSSRLFILLAILQPTIKTFNKKILFTSKLELNLSKKLVKCYIWSVALCGAETWTLG
jgi:hypothetical protein